MKKIKNYYGFVGLLGLMGFIGVFTKNREWLFFFVWLLECRYFNIIPDEMFKQNLFKSAGIAFFITCPTMLIFIGIANFTNNADLLRTGLTVSFAVAVFFFVVMKQFYEDKEKNQGKEQ